MRVVFSSQADKDWRYWEKHNPAVLDKIRTLLHEVEADPFKGTGKPEPLKENWRGYWSRRITGEHRLVYKVEDGKIFLAQCRYHYSKK